MNIPLIFPSPLLNAAGSLGFAPDLDGPIDLDLLGAFITKPISARPRKAAKGQRLSHVPGGVIMHSGHPNPGLSATIRTYSARWAECPIPIIVNLLGGSEDNLGSMVERLEMLENVMAIELGLPWDIAPSEAAQITKEALGELPLIVRLPLPRAFDLAPKIIGAVAAWGHHAAPLRRWQSAWVHPAAQRRWRRWDLWRGDTRPYGRLYGPSVRNPSSPAQQLTFKCQVSALPSQ